LVGSSSHRQVGQRPSTSALAGYRSPQSRHSFIG
jgi:hypothetical protein